MSHLISMGANRIIIGCNTAHVFLKNVLEKLPHANEYLIDLIDITARKCNMLGCSIIKLFASEGTYLSKIYPEYFNKYGIKVENSDNQVLIRKLIEDVKQNKINEDSVSSFLDLIQNDMGGGGIE